jgi:hypothetical protein
MTTSFRRDPRSPVRAVGSTGTLLTPPPRRRYLLLGASPGLVWYSRAGARINRVDPADRRSAVRPAALPETRAQRSYSATTAVERGPMGVASARCAALQTPRFYAAGEPPRFVAARASRSTSRPRLLPERGQKCLWRGQKCRAGDQKSPAAAGNTEPGGWPLARYSALASRLAILGGRQKRGESDVP